MDEIIENPMNENIENPIELKPVLNLEEIEISHRIGGGQYGDVYVGLWRGTNKVALKKLKNEENKEFENEFSLLMKLKDPNVVTIFGLYYDAGEKYIVMEYLSKGNLSDFLYKAKEKNKIGLTDLLLIAGCITAGMTALHEKKIIHRDLAARNLLVSKRDRRHIVKVADFGLSRDLEGGNYYDASDKRFPVKWSPPEVIDRLHFSLKSDVWSFGVVLWEIFEYGSNPYRGMNNSEAIEYVRSGKRLPQPDDCPDEIFEMMKQCWSKEPNERPTFPELHKRISTLSKSRDRNNSIIVDSTNTLLHEGSSNYEKSQV